jgi:hypothetical protein
MKTRETDRVRASTADAVNEEIDRSTRSAVRVYAGRGSQAISRRIGDLEREWDIERTLELNASSIALTGLALGMTVSKKWLIVPGIVLPFLLQHAIQGWCPPLPILRRLGIRTREEIDREKYALKLLRGDFRDAENPHAAVDSVTR